MCWSKHTSYIVSSSRQIQRSTKDTMSTDQRTRGDFAWQLKSTVSSKPKAGSARRNTVALFGLHSGNAVTVRYDDRRPAGQYRGSQVSGLVGLSRDFQLPAIHAMHTAQSIIDGDHCILLYIGSLCISSPLVLQLRNWETVELIH